MTADKKNQCLADLRMRILRQDIAPGSDLDEAALCEQYGVSRTPMREIFQQLGGEGYLQREQNRNAKVTSMGLEVMRMLFRTAPTIYANVARLAAENRLDEEVQPLRDIQKRFRAAISGPDAGEAALLDHRFHLRIGEMAHNPYLLPSLNRMLIDHTRLSRIFYRPTTQDEAKRVRMAVNHHDEMIDAIERQEADRIVELTIDHWTLSRDRLAQYVTPDPLPMDVPAETDRQDAV